MEITELDGRVSPVPPADPEEATAEVAMVESPRQNLGSNRVAPAPDDLEQGGEQPPAGADTGAELQLMQPPAGITTTAADRDGSGNSLASKSGLKSAQAAWLDVRHDATELPHAVRQKVLFQYMCPDTVCVHGLRDWSVDEWARALEQQPQASAQFLTSFLGASAVNNLVNNLSTVGGSGMGGSGGADLPQQRLAAAHRVRARMLEPLEGADWELVCRFQNFVTRAAATATGHAPLNRGLSSLDAPAEGQARRAYLDAPLFWNYMLARDFPLGVDERLVEQPWEFAVAQSGAREVGHRRNSVVSLLVILSMLALFVFAMFYLLRLMVGTPELWTLASTVQDASESAARMLINARTKDRGTVASCLQSFSFSLTVNAFLDKFGRIDPSTSTVFVGMTLGGTFGFVLDNMVGADEGFREYLWSPQGGMKYAVGALATARYGRYLLTIVFDMFFTVILFKILYAKLVRVAGFSKHGREWVANGMVSAFISIVTYQVYANMTRFEWAYPSGSEDVKEQWISGSTMILATVIMNAVYLVSETRVKVGEPGINDPGVKVVVTMVTYGLLFALQWQGVMDPSIATPVTNATVVADPRDTHLPLGGVCETQARWVRGAMVFTLICTGCLGFVIFATGKQSLSGLRRVVRGAEPLAVPPARLDLLLGKLVLFLVFNGVSLAIILFFTFTPIYNAGEARNRTAWGDACDANDELALAALGLS